MKMKRMVIGVVAVVVIGVVVVKDSTKSLTVRPADVSQGAIQAYIEERAHTSLPHLYHITMPLQGRLLPIELEEGDAITNGQVVARIEDIDWKDAKEQLGEMVVAMENTVAASLAQVKASEARTAFAKWIWEAYDKAGSEAVSEQEKRRSKWQYYDSQVKLDGSTAAFHAMSAFDSITRMLQPFVARNLERTTVKSPVAGTLLKRHVWNEKVITPGTALLDIGNLSELEITAEVLTEEAIRIQPGDRVEIFGESFGDRHMRGSVRRIEPEAFTKLSSLGVEQQRVNVNIAFDPTEFAQLKEAGYTVGLRYRVRVRIVTDEVNDAVLIPRTALFRGSAGGWQAYRIAGGRAELVDLKIGLSNNYVAEVLDGLLPGDRVVDAPESAVEDGARVASVREVR
jgi:HlyD family secretion protein